MSGHATDEPFRQAVTALAFGLFLATAGAAVYVLRAATTIPASYVAPADASEGLLNRWDTHPRPNRGAFRRA
jgi:hypothetical protein